MVSELTALQPGFHLCLNCGHPTKGKNEFQGVIVCSNCLALAKMCERRARQQVEHLYTMYVESVRVALATGRLQPSNTPWKPDDSRKPPTMDDLKQLLQGLADLTKK
jgi:transcription elongation factor Elf1